MVHVSPARARTAAVLLMVGLVAVLGACGRTPSASTRTTGAPVPASATPTSVDLPFPAPTSALAPSRTPEPGATSEVAVEAEPTETPSVVPTPRAAATPTDEAEEPTEVPTATPPPTATREPRATATPASQATPEATATAEPTATTEPTETSTPSGTTTPTPFPTIDGVPLTKVGCEISPGTEVRVGDVLTFVATQEPSGLPISFVFNHGNGTIDPRGTSVGRYDAPGTYPVSLQWTVFESSGTVSCGSVTVTGVGAADFQPGDYVGLSEDEARTLASQRGLASVRVIRRDDESFVGTTDFRTDRLNLEIDGGTVTTASIG